MLATFLSDIEDFRRRQGQRYSLHHTLLFSFLAVCCNANSYREISIFIQTHLPKLCDYFSLHWSSAPHHTTIRNHIMGVSTEELEAACRAFCQHLLAADAFQTDSYNHIAVDGKTLCGSSDPANAKRAVQSLSFFFVARQLILGQVSISEKTNEIPVFQQLLYELQIPDALFSADALHMQSETFRIAEQQGHGVFIQLKDNQKELAEDVRQLIKLEKPDDIHRDTIEGGHGRIEQRTAQVYTHAFDSHIMDDTWLLYIRSVVCIRRRRMVKSTLSGQWTESSEQALYLSNRQLSAQQANRIARDHWAIENKNHYVRDTTFEEDKRKIRIKSFNFSIIITMVLNFFRANKLNHIRQQRFAFALNWTDIYRFPQAI